MMNKFALTLLSSSTVFGSMLFMPLADKPAYSIELSSSAKESAPERWNPKATPINCSCSFNSVEIDTTAIPEDRPNSPSETPMLNFTEEESDAAIQKFGCDCLACINTIRKMQGLLPASIL
jgi:hypothetical protein